MRTSDTFAPLRGREFRLLFSGQAVSIFGDGLFLVALAFAVQEVTKSRVAIGIVLAAGVIPLVGLVLVGGVWADRLKRHRVMLAADAARAAIHATMAVLLITGVAEIWQLAVLNALHGTAAAFFNPASTALLPEVVDERDLQQANGLLGMTRSTVMIAGGAIAGILVDVLGAGVAIAIDGATFVVSAACLLAMRPRPRPPTDREPFLQELAAGWREVRSRSWVWMTILIFALMLMLYIAPFEVVGSVVSKRDYGGATVFGLATAAIAVGTGVGNVFVIRGRITSPVVVSATLLMATAVSPLLLAIVAPVWVLLPFYFVEGVGVGLFMGTWATALQRGIPADRLSRVSAWDWMGSLSGLPLGYVLAGVLVEVVGSDAMLYGMSVCSFLLAAWMILAPPLRGVGREQAEESGEVAAPVTTLVAAATTRPQTPGAAAAVILGLGALFALLRSRRRARRRRRRQPR